MNIVSHRVVDWDDAYAVPLQKAAVYPKLLEFAPGDEFPDLPDDYIEPDLSVEKASFLTVLAEKEHALTGCTKLAKLIETSSERNFFELALNRERVRAEWARKYCLRTGDNVREASRSLHDFMAVEKNADWLNESVGGASAVVELVYEFERLEMEAPYMEYLSN